MLHLWVLVLAASALANAIRVDVESSVGSPYSQLVQNRQISEYEYQSQNRRALEILQASPSLQAAFARSQYQPCLTQRRVDILPRLPTQDISSGVYQNEYFDPLERNRYINQFRELSRNQPEPIEVIEIETVFVEPPPKPKPRTLLPLQSYCTAQIYADNQLADIFGQLNFVDPTPADKSIAVMLFVIDSMAKAVANGLSYDDVYNTEAILLSLGDLLPEAAKDSTIEILSKFYIYIAPMREIVSEIINDGDEVWDARSVLRSITINELVACDRKVDAILKKNPKLNGVAALLIEIAKLSQLWACVRDDFEAAAAAQNEEQYFANSKRSLESSTLQLAAARVALSKLQPNVKTDAVHNNEGFSSSSSSNSTSSSSSSSSVSSATSDSSSFANSSGSSTSSSSDSSASLANSDSSSSSSNSDSSSSSATSDTSSSNVANSDNSSTSASSSSSSSSNNVSSADNSPSSASSAISDSAASSATSISSSNSSSSSSSLSSSSSSASARADNAQTFSRPVNFSRSFPAPPDGFNNSNFASSNSSSSSASSSSSSSSSSSANSSSFDRSA